MGHLQVLEPLRPFTIAIAVIALFLAYRQIFRLQASCAPGDVCAVPRIRTINKAVFWVVALLVVVAIAYPYVIPYFL